MNTFEELHPDLSEEKLGYKLRVYKRTDAQDNLVEFWKRDENEVMQDLLADETDREKIRKACRDIHFSDIVISSEPEQYNKCKIKDIPNRNLFWAEGNKYRILMFKENMKAKCFFKISAYNSALRFVGIYWTDRDEFEPASKNEKVLTKCFNSNSEVSYGF